MDVYFYLVYWYLGTSRRWRTARSPPLWQAKLSIGIRITTNLEKKEEARARGPSPLDGPSVDVDDDGAPDDEDDDQKQKHEVECVF
jgi:hypothetical protein